MYMYTNAIISNNNNNNNNIIIIIIIIIVVSRDTFCSCTNHKLILLRLCLIHTLYVYKLYMYIYDCTDVYMYICIYMYMYNPAYPMELVTPSLL